jgi:hypothetical protein
MALEKRKKKIIGGFWPMRVVRPPQGPKLIFFLLLLLLLLFSFWPFGVKTLIVF